MARFGVLTAAVAATLGCAADDPLTVSPPTLAGMRSTVTAVLRRQPTGAAQLLRLEAADAPTSALDLDGVDRALDLEVVTLYYDRPLAELGLAPGSITPVQDGLRPLPEAVFLRGLTVRADDVLPWTTLADLPPALAALRLGPLGRPCPTRTEIPLPQITPADGAARFVLPLDETHALVGTTGVLLRVGTDATVVRLTPPAGLPVDAATLVSTSSAPPAGDPRARLVYFSGRRLRLWSAWVGEGIQRPVELVGPDTLDPSVVAAIHWLAASAEGAEVFALTERGYLLQRDGAVWRQRFPHAQGEAAAPKVFLGGGLARLGAGEVMSGHAHTPALVHVIGEECHEHTLHPDFTVAGVATAADGRTVAATVNGHLFEHDPTHDSWRPLSPKLPTVGGESVRAHGAGWLVTGQIGLITYFRRWDTACDLSLSEPRSVYFAVPVGDYIIAGTEVTYIDDLPRRSPVALLRVPWRQ